MNSAETNDGTPSDEHTRPSLSLATVATGLEAGLFATVVMTVFREPTARALPPTAELLTKWFGGDADDYHLRSLGLHLVYGAIAGGLFAPILAALDAERTHPEAVGLVVGGVYGLALSVFGEAVLLHRYLDMDLATDESAVFHAGHLIYGLALGAWLGSRA
ncbi:hypothetical protein [Halococcus hamelinensis]|uniref:Uncharacterized protein n=1 Tax=Halococcus hamelinensis 100A6 TaxID=1132509 RepID=M0M6A8_9EURY|nr:hypothetical protein [Halococcus hamelinensis]EMA41236.1 hypothetical protein C447_02287 [Halococcus hamelinensis 100A6]